MQPVSSPIPLETKDPFFLLRFFVPLLLQDLEELRSQSRGLATLHLLLAQLFLLESRGVRVEAQQDLLVLERVLLLHTGALGLSVALGRAQDALDFGAVDQTGEVGLGNNVGGQEEVLLQGGGLGSGAVDLVEGLEGGGGPDDESAKVTTGGQLQQVQGVDGRGLNTCQVAEALDELLAIHLGVIDDKGTTALAVAATTELALAGAQLLRALDLLQVGTSTNGLQETESSGGLGECGAVESSRVDDERNLGDGHDLVTAGEEEGGNGGGSQSRGGSETPGRMLELFKSPRNFHSRRHSLLALVDLDVPLAPDLGRSEHTTRSAHVTESSLTSTVSTTTRDTRNTSDSATCEVVGFKSARRFSSLKFCQAAKILGPSASSLYQPLPQNERDGR